MTLKSYKDGAVNWSLVKTFDLSLLTGEVDVTEAKLYAGDVDAGGTHVLTENYKRTRKVTYNPLAPDTSNEATGESASGVTFYTMDYEYSPARWAPWRPATCSAPTRARLWASSTWRRARLPT